eukprot:m.231437 g.231437  ORF g.231437 m.231437 type:complete len:192 (+) comp18361_c0_seq1:202-777(+)
MVGLRAAIISVLLALVAGRVLPTYENLASSVQIGPAINFTLAWTADLARGQLAVCFSASNRTSTDWIGLGFAAQPQNMMNQSDIVVGYFGSSGKPQVVSLFSDDTEGYPSGQPTLSISKTTFSLVGSTMTVCFTRPLASGHVTVNQTTAVIWAVGPTSVDGDITYHGGDDDDPSGRTQTHRSQNIPTFRWW